MSRTRDALLTLTLLALVFSGPAAVAAYLLAGDRDEVPLMLYNLAEVANARGQAERAAGLRRRAASHPAASAELQEFLRRV